MAHLTTDDGVKLYYEEVGTGEPLLLISGLGANRNAWATIAAGLQIIVAAPVADEMVDVDGQAGASWSVPPDSPSDYDLFAAVLADVESHYNIDRDRVAGWGFSSGGSVMHALGLTSVSNAFNNSTLAAYALLLLHEKHPAARPE